MKRTAWIIRVAKTPEGKWRAMKPVWSMRSGKPLLTQRAEYNGSQIETSGGHFEIEWYEGGKRRRKNVGEQPGDAVKGTCKTEAKNWKRKRLESPWPSRKRRTASVP